MFIPTMNRSLTTLALALRDVYIAQVKGKRQIGTFQALDDRLCFWSLRCKRIDIQYDNIKHAIFLPFAYGQDLVLQFTLYKQIEIDGDRFDFIELFPDVKRFEYDLRKAGLMEEEEDEDDFTKNALRRRLNILFKQFTRYVHKKSDFKVIFEIPIPNVFFTTNTGRFKGFFVTLNCIIGYNNGQKNKLSVLTLDDIEHVVITNMKENKFTINFIPQIEFTNGYDFEKFKKFEDLKRGQEFLLTNFFKKINIPVTTIAYDINIDKNYFTEINKNIAGFIEDGGWNGI